MSGRWWRAYDRSRHNPKLLKLSDRNFRWWFNLVCVASEKGGVLPSHADLAAEFRVTGKVMTDVLDALIAAELLDHGDDGIRPHDWDTLQYASDSSSNRVKAFRKRRRNVTETPSESDTDTEKDSVAKATGGGPPPVDLTKLAFDAGVAVLTASGKSESSARGLVGKWRKQFGDEAVFAVLGECQRQSVTDPASWMEAALKARAEPRRKPWEKPEPGMPMSHNDAGQWRARVLGWTPGRFWNRGDWGPEPGEPGCRVPAPVLAEWQAGQGGNA